MTPEIKRWFIEKVAQNPEYIGSTYLPALEREIFKAETQLRAINRTGTFEDIKKATGFLDGAENVIRILEGLRLAERKPDEPGLMARIFSRTNSNPSRHPG